MTCPQCGTDHHAPVPETGGDDAIAEAIETAAEVDAAARVDVAELDAERAGDDNDTREQIAETEAGAAVAIAEAQADAIVRVAEAQADADVAIAEADAAAAVAIAEPPTDDVVELDDDALVDELDEPGGDAGPVAVLVPQLDDEPGQPPAEARRRTVSAFHARRARR